MASLVCAGALAATNGRGRAWGPAGSREVTRVKKIYVGNLSFDLTDQDLRKVYSQFGEVVSAAVVMDRDTGRSRGFGFVEMDDAAATTAIEKTNGMEVGGRALNVNEARPREPRPSNRPRW